MILFVLALGLLALFARAVQIQIFQKDQWEKEVQERHITEGQLQTSRGRILDVKGREMAINAACIDAVIDYRVITRPADEKWITEYARSCLLRDLGNAYKNAPPDQRKQLLAEQVAQVHTDIEQMWHDLGKPELTGYTPEQIEDRREQIVRRVQMLRRSRWYNRYAAAGKKYEQQQTAWWRRWLYDGVGVDVDAFDISIEDQRASHVILPAISSDLANYLGKNMDRYPGLSLQPGEHRVYPMKTVASHVLGYIGPVSREDLDNDPNHEEKELRRKYLPNDTIGRAGVESLCEQLLRGARGQTKRDNDTDKLIESVSAEPGQDVRLTIDSALQQKIEHAFATRVMTDRSVDPDPLYGAAVVIDVPTNEVRALVSYPTYDINGLDKTYAVMERDYLNRPLLNRATQAQHEPGSTVKPMLGIAGITEKVVGVREGIECTGKLILDGKAVSGGKCWTYKTAKSEGLSESDWGHHRIGGGVPHVGKYGNPDGFLVFEDALERSCNVWCETVADRLGPSRLGDWYSRFGLGRSTGLGIPEARGRLPYYGAGPQLKQRARTCLAGIGHGDVLATPIQIANMVATIARDGTWMRPKLVGGGFVPASVTGPNEVKLPVDPEALQAAKKGMWLVVNSKAGSGTWAHMPDIEVAGKTGSTENALLRVPVLDEKGNVIKENGEPKMEYLALSTKANRNPRAPWYRGAGKNENEAGHAWFMGFAPYDRPRIAFAVMVEYGGSGGKMAGPIAKALLEACREEGYLPPLTVKP